MYRFVPKGDLDIDDLIVAICNHIQAKQKNETFLLHAKDEAKSKDIAKLLNSFGLEFQSQSHQDTNLKFHLQFASKLLQDGKAFTCFCDEKSIEEKQKNARKNGKIYKYDGTCKNLTNSEVLNNEKPFTIRIKRPQKSLSIKDTLSGKLTSEDMDDFVIMKKDKYPTYNFACGVDDMIFNTSHIIKSKKYISDTFKQLHVRDSLGYMQEISYTHLPTFLEQELTLAYLLENGYLPEAIVNYLILLWFKTPKEIFTLNEAINWFDLSAVLKTPVKFDINKLKEINKKHKDKK